MILKAKNWPILKKKGHYRPKKQAGAEIQKKKDFFGQKLWKNWFKGQKLTNIKKKGLFWPKKQAGAELKWKTGFLGQKLGQKLRIRSKN